GGHTLRPQRTSPRLRLIPRGRADRLRARGIRMTDNRAIRTVKRTYIQRRGADVVPDIFDQARRGPGRELDPELHVQLLVRQIDDDGQLDCIRAEIAGDSGLLTDELRQAVRARCDRRAVHVVENGVDVTL